MAARTAPPAWFKVVGALLLVWGLIGFGGFVADRMMTPAMLAKLSAFDRELYATRPAWAVWAYGVATVTGLAGAILLLLRRRAALPVYAASLVFVVILFGWSLGATGLIAEKGVLGAAGLPIVIAAIGVFQVWLVRRAIGRGWIG